MSTRAKNTYTVKELKQTAKDRGLKGYSKLRKQELLDLVFPTSLQTSKTPILQPSMFGKVWNSLRNKSANAWNSVKNTFNKCTNWVLDHIRSKQEADELIDLFKEKIKHLDTKKKNNFELKEGKSDLWTV